MNNTNIFFIKSSEFKKYLDEKTINYFLNGNNFKSQKRIEQYCLGRFLINYVLKNFYAIDDIELIIENNKPCLKNKKIEFSLSHSENIVLVAFSKNPIGADIEIIKNRNFKALISYYNLKLQDIDAELFYRLWTRYEAFIKIQDRPNTELTFKLLDKYMVTLCTKENTDKEKAINLFEIKLTNKISSLLNLDKNDCSISEINIYKSDKTKVFDELELKIK